MVDAIAKGAWESEKQISPDGASSLIDALHRQEIRLRSGESVNVTISMEIPSEMLSAIFEVSRQREVLIRKTIGAGIVLVPGGLEVHVNPGDTENHPTGPGWSWDLTVTEIDTSQGEIEYDDAREPIPGTIGAEDLSMEDFDKIKLGWIVEHADGTNATVTSTEYPWIFIHGSLRTCGSNLGNVIFRPINRSVVAGGPWVCRVD